MPEVTLTKQAMRNLKSILLTKLTLANYLISKRSIDKHALDLITDIRKNLATEIANVQGYGSKTEAAFREHIPEFKGLGPLYERTPEKFSIPERFQAIIEGQRSTLSDITRASQPIDLSEFFVLVSVELSELFALQAVTEDTIIVANDIFRKLEQTGIRAPRIPLPKKSAPPLTEPVKATEFNIQQHLNDYNGFKQAYDGGINAAIAFFAVNNAGKPISLDSIDAVSLTFGNIIYFFSDICKNTDGKWYKRNLIASLVRALCEQSNGILTFRYIKTCLPGHEMGDIYGFNYKGTEFEIAPWAARTTITTWQIRSLTSQDKELLRMQRMLLERLFFLRVIPRR